MRRWNHEEVGTVFSPEIRERAVRMVREHRSEYESRWAVIVSIAGKIGCTVKTLRKWVRQYGSMWRHTWGKRARTTRPDPAAPCPQDRVNC